jgi:hypothetical protein
MSLLCILTFNCWKAARKLSEFPFSVTVFCYKSLILPIYTAMTLVKFRVQKRHEIPRLVTLELSCE